MPLIAPLALAGLAFIPLVVAFYLLKLRRDEHVVPSTLLWQRLVVDVEANAPWQRLRRSLLLLLQLLLVAILAVLAARPFVERPAGLARDIVLVIDTSASMGATDGFPNRLEAAKQAALDALRDLPSGGSVSVIAAGSTARVIANGTTDLGRIRQAVGNLVVEPAAGDLADALRLAGGLASRVADAEIVVATDGALARPPDVRVDAPVKVLRVGRGRRNQAIVALAVRTAPSSVTRSIFVSVANLDLESADRRLEIWGDGRLLEARDVKLDPQSRSDVGIDDLPRDVGVVEVRLVGANTGAPTAGADGTAAPDDLAVDDRAWAVVPPDRLRRVLLVGAGDPYLSTALSYLPDTEVYGVAPEKIMLIHHGIPDVPLDDTAAYKVRLGLAGRQVLLTFGLLSPGKGIETVIRALPPVVARHPDSLYVVLGATHPHIKAAHGEAYRQSLHDLASELGVADHVAFHDRFIDLPELVEYIGAADIYITPYLGREQITSGALAYTVGAGKAVISTPYPDAAELLAHGRGLLVPFGDSTAIAAQVGHLLDEPEARRTLGENAYRYGRQMIWPTVARCYLDCFAGVLAERQATYPTVLAVLAGRVALATYEATLS